MSTIEIHNSRLIFVVMLRSITLSGCYILSSASLVARSL